MSVTASGDMAVIIRLGEELLPQPSRLEAQTTPRFE